MQSFDESYLLANRSQRDDLLFYVRYLYEVAFEPPYELGYTSALAWILIGVLALLIAPVVWSARWWVFHAEEARSG